MKIFMVLLCIGLFTMSVFLIARFGLKKKEGKEYINATQYNENEEKH